MRKLPRYAECFICGKKNIAGTNVTFIATEEGVETEYTAMPKHQSYKGILHGGIISALLDECIGWAVGMHMKKMFVTGELNVRYLQPVPIGTTIIIKGFANRDEDSNKKYYTSFGQIEDKCGTIYAKAEGKFFPIPEEAETHVFQMLENDDNPDIPVTAEDIWGYSALPVTNKQF